MKYSLSAALGAALAVQNVAAHATFQMLWVDGVDYDTQCARTPATNSPVTDVTSTDMACNAGSSAVTSKCPVTAGSKVTVEMHQQPNDRSCSNEALGGAHYGPVLVYMAAVADASAAEGADAAWFKVFEDTWSANGTSGASDNWGTKDLNTCCGMMDVTVPADLAPGDYLLRAEAIALHSAGGEGGAQFYMTCYQITVTGGDGSAAPETVSIPGAYAASDPGILINIYQELATYEAPGPAVYAGGSTKSAGAPCANCEATCTAGSGATGAATSGGAAATTSSSAAASSAPTSSSSSSAAASSSSTAAVTTTSAPVSSSSAAAVTTSSASSSSAPVEVAQAATTPSAAYAAAALPTSASTSASGSGSGSSCNKKRRNRLARGL